MFSQSSISKVRPREKGPRKIVRWKHDPRDLFPPAKQWWALTTNWILLCAVHIVRMSRWAQLLNHSWKSAEVIISPKVSPFISGKTVVGDLLKRGPEHGPFCHELVFKPIDQFDFLTHIHAHQIGTHITSKWHQGLSSTNTEVPLSPKGCTVFGLKSLSASRKTDSFLRIVVKCVLNGPLSVVLVFEHFRVKVGVWLEFNPCLKSLHEVHCHPTVHSTG